jgi:hypothetical protein
MNNRNPFWLICLCAWCLCFAPLARAADSFQWDAKQNQVSADVESLPLAKLLEKISASAGWQIYLEPGTIFIASAKFKDLPLGDGLRSLFGNLSFALVPQTNAPPKLFVFHTSLQAATQLISLAPPKGKLADGKPIPNQLIVRVKRGVNIDELARKLGAKVIGRADALNTYLLEFDSAEAAQAARNALAANPDVVAVDYNYYMSEPTPLQQLLASSSAGFNLRAKPVGSGNPVIIGLIDTGIQPDEACGLSSFFLPTISAAGRSASAANSPTHGTAMAETALRSISANTGGATSVRILPVDVYGTNANSTTFDVAYGIYSAVNAGANVINLSLASTGESPFLHSVIQSARQQGVLFFAAAGNEPVTTPTYPAAYPEVVAVTASDYTGSIASYANRGNFVDAVAPGGSVICFRGQSWYVAGTSAATAYASGIAAGLADASGKTPGQVEAIVRDALSPKSTATR